MHDIDRTSNEFGMDSGEFQTGEIPFEYETLPGMGLGDEISSPFNELQETELAAELLSLSNEAELNQFLGDLIKKAGSAVGSFVSSPTGQALGGLLKSAAKKALPVVGGAIGGYFGGPTGASLGSKLASTAGNLFGLEIETLNPADREFEMAKRFVRLGGGATVRAIQVPKHITPLIAARTAVAAAARQFVPGLVGSLLAQSGQQPFPQHPFVEQPVTAPPFMQTDPSGTTGRNGRWIRRGRKVILFGV